GIILMWAWMKRWPVWMKTILSLPLLLLLVGVLFAFVLIAIDPAKQLEKARNVQRTSNVSAIMNAVSAYKRDHNGQLPEGITSSPLTISSDGADICSALVPSYMNSLP